MNEIVTIYGLIDPRTNKFFYVGKTIDIKKRYHQHIKQKDSNPYKNNVINKIKKAGLTPQIKELYTFKNYTDKSLKSVGGNNNWWEYVEIFYINYYRNVLNQPLTNISKGGDGGEPGLYGKTVLQFTKNGILVKSHQSINEAARSVKTKEKTISKCCHRKSKTSKGYQWCFLGDEGQITPIILKKKISVKNFPRRPVLQFDLNGKYIKTFNLLKTAVYETKINTSSISSCCMKRIKSAGGFQWCYEGEEEFITKYIAQDHGELPVLQFTLDGKLIQTFNSISEAERNTGVSNTEICKCCKKKSGSKSAGGYQWCYKGEENKIGLYVNHNELLKKPVLQYSMDGIFLKKYDSVKGASRESGIGRSSIKQNLTERSNSAGGYIWKYEKNSSDDGTRTHEVIDHAL